jgi:hypothetical protein
VKTQDPAPFPGINEPPAASATGTSSNARPGFASCEAVAVLLHATAKSSDNLAVFSTSVLDVDYMEQAKLSQVGDLH